MQETVKVNYVQYGKCTKKKKPGKFQQSTTNRGSDRGSGSCGNPSKFSGNGKKLLLLADTCYRHGKGRHQKGQDCKAVNAVCTGWNKRSL